MSILNDIQQHLLDEGFEDILRREAPKETNDVVWIVESPSPPPNPSIGYYEQHLDFWGRFRITQDVIDALQDIFNVLHRQVSWDTDNYHIYLSAANNLIEDLDRDMEGRKLMKFSMRFIYRELEDLS